MRIKQWWKSRTHWFNMSALMSWVGLALMYINQIGLDPVLAGRIGFGLAIAQSLGNFYLRHITKDAIGTPPDAYEDHNDAISD